MGSEMCIRDRVNMALLEVKDLHYYYGNVHALKGVSLEVNEGEIVTLIGSNGAGKTTLLQTLSGLTSPKGVRGQVFFDGKDITGMRVTKSPAWAWLRFWKAATFSRS